MDAEAIRDLFAALGPVRTRRMFGGQGIYAGELMFALEAGGELYLKADDWNERLSRSRVASVHLREGRTQRADELLAFLDAPAEDPEQAAH